MIHENISPNMLERDMNYREFPDINKKVSILITKGHTREGMRDIFINHSGIIEDIGTDLVNSYKKEADIEINAEDMFVSPGFVNLHTHASMTLLRGYADDMCFHRWLHEKITPVEGKITPKDVYDGTRLACLEMIRSGTTTFHDMYFFTTESARAAHDMHMRAVISFGFIDSGDSDFFEQVQNNAEKYVHMVRSWNNSLVTPGIGPHSIYTVTKKGLAWTQEFHEEHHAPIHIHLSETMQEVETCRKEYQTTPVGLLRKTGLLHPGTVAAHCCWLDDGECLSVGKEGMHVAHCPVSNLKLAVGKVMPYPRLKAAGAHVGLGTDGAASNNSLNMMETMRMASHLQKFAWNDTSILPPGEVLTIATESGAKALQLRTGILKKGFPADIILMKRGISIPCRFGCDPSSQIQNGGVIVDTTICNGRILMLHEYIPGEEEILQAACNAAERLMHEE